MVRIQLFSFLKFLPLFKTPTKKKYPYLKKLKQTQALYLSKPLLHKFPLTNFFLHQIITKRVVEFFYYSTLFFILKNKRNRISYSLPNLTLLMLTNKWLKIYYYYTFLWEQPYLDLFFLKQKYYLRNLSIPHYQLILTFRQEKLFVNLLNKHSINYLSLSLGLFTRFFSVQKSFKKNKILKIVLVKYLRKLFLLTKLHFIDLFVKSSPFMLLELLTYLFEPSQKAFKDPLSGRMIDETRFNYKTFNLNYIYFFKSRQYNILKTRKKGRIKRKLQKKLIKLNKKID